MENAAAFMVFLLVGMVIPISLLLGALVFDVCVLAVVTFNLWRHRGWPALQHIAEHGRASNTAPRSMCGAGHVL